MPLLPTAWLPGPLLPLQCSGPCLSAAWHPARPAVPAACHSASPCMPAEVVHVSLPPPRRFSLTNPMHADIFPSVRKMEGEVVQMTASLLGGEWRLASTCVCSSAVDARAGPPWCLSGSPQPRPTAAVATTLVSPALPPGPTPAATPDPHCPPAHALTPQAVPRATQGSAAP